MKTGLGKARGNEMNIQQIVNFASKLFTKDNITFALALFGSLGTAWNIFQSRRRLSIKINYFGHSSEKCIALANMQFSNKSRLPISISDVCVKVNNVYYSCKKRPVLADSNRHEWGKNVSVKDFYSVQFPLAMLALGGIGGYLVFDIPQGVDIPLSMPLTFLISTNRGRPFEVQLSPDQVYSC